MPLTITYDPDSRYFNISDATGKTISVSANAIYYFHFRGNGLRKPTEYFHLYWRDKFVSVGKDEKDVVERQIFGAAADAGAPPPAGR